MAALQILQHLRLILRRRVTCHTTNRGRIRRTVVTNVPEKPDTYHVVLHRLAGLGLNEFQVPVFVHSSGPMVISPLVQIQSESLGASTSTPSLFARSCAIAAEH